MMLDLIILLVAAASIIGSLIILRRASKTTTDNKVKIAEEQAEISRIKEEKANLLNDIFDLRKDVEQINEQHAKAIEAATSGMRKQQEQIDEGLKKYEAMIERSKNELLQKFDFERKQAETDFHFYTQSIDEQKQAKQEELSSLQRTIDTINELIQKEQEQKSERSKHLLQISDKSVREIKILQSVEDKLADPRPLRMVIWQSYFSKPANELCSRVLGKEEVCGIYKITNTKTKMCYIGQAKSVKTRWREHMKCGLGIDTPVGNKLYAAMQEDGLENFTFELLESCSPAELNDKERTYIDIFSSYDFGYNSNKGIKKESK